MLRSAAIALVALSCSPAPLPEPTPPAASSSAPIAAPAPPPKLTPVPGTLPTTPARKLEVHAVCSVTSCEPPTPAAGPVTMWSQHIDAEAVLEIPKEDERTTYGVVLAGAVDVDDEPVGVWQAFRSGASVQITSGAPADLVIARVTGPSAAALSVVDIAGQRDLVFAGGSSHVRIVFEDGPASLQVMLTSRDAPVPKHQHEKAWEVIGLLSANGTFSMGGDPVAASAERILAIPPATEHAWQPAGDMPLLAVQLYVPPGPEQRFKQLAESAGPP